MTKKAAPKPTKANSLLDAKEPLRVHLFSDAPDEWYAQGLEVDYISQGLTAKEAIDNFESGLSRTVDLHLTRHKNVKLILSPHPLEGDPLPTGWQDFYALVSGTACTVLRRPIIAGIPFFDSISYYMKQDVKV